MPLKLHRAKRARGSSIGRYTEFCTPEEVWEEDFELRDYPTFNANGLVKKLISLTGISPRQGVLNEFRVDCIYFKLNKYDIEDEKLKNFIEWLEPIAEAEDCILGEW